MSSPLSRALRARIERADDPDRRRAFTTLWLVVTTGRVNALFLDSFWQTVRLLSQYFAWLTAALFEATVTAFRRELVLSDVPS